VKVKLAAFLLTLALALLAGLPPAEAQKLGEVFGLLVAGARFGLWTRPPLEFEFLLTY